MSRARIHHLRQRFQVFYGRHRRAFWTLHSLWALATGVVVLVLSHERYGFAVWVMAFLGLTWLSTLFFSRLATRQTGSSTVRLGHELVSYLTRVMYQETLFFLLPFYFTSAAWPSWGFLFVGLLAALATLACLDLVFDDLLRRHRAFGLAFFAVVAFAALSFLLPTVFGVRLTAAAPLAATLGLGAALPLVYHARDLRRPRTFVEVGGAALLVALFLWQGRGVVPPVPLRLEHLTLAADVEPDALAAVRPLGASASIREAGLERVVAVAEIFAPRRLPSLVTFRWHRDGALVRTSREAEITPHRLGFRVWDALAGADALAPGSYSVEIRTVSGQLIGHRTVELSG